MHDDESKMKIILQFDENMSLCEGARYLAQADKARKRKERTMQEYAREHKVL
jgi:hypothetical protein